MVDVPIAVPIAAVTAAPSTPPGQAPPDPPSDTLTPVSAFTSAIPIPDSAATQINGPMRGTPEMLSGLIERSTDALAIHRELSALSLFGAKRTHANGKEHPLIASVLELRDGYLRALKRAEMAHEILMKMEKVVEDIADDDQAVRAAESLASAVKSMTKYDALATDQARAISRAVRELVDSLTKIAGVDLAVVLEDVKRVRAEIDVERRKITAGVTVKVAETLRVAAGALLRERERRRVVAGDGDVAGA